MKRKRERDGRREREEKERERVSMQNRLKGAEKRVAVKVMY